MELVKCFFLFLFLEENRKLKDIIVFFFFSLISLLDCIELK